MRCSLSSGLSVSEVAIRAVICLSFRRGLSLTISMMRSHAALAHPQ
jgi:hypothetical protein